MSKAKLIAGLAACSLLGLAGIAQADHGRHGGGRGYNDAPRYYAPARQHRKAHRRHWRAHHRASHFRGRHRHDHRYNRPGRYSGSTSGITLWFDGIGVTFVDRHYRY